MEGKTEFVSVKQFAEIFGVKPTRVYEYISDGSLKAIKLKGVRRISISEVERVRRDGLEVKSETALAGAA